MSEPERPPKTKSAVSTQIRRMAKENEYHASKHKDLWYIGNMACEPRWTPQEGLTDKQAIEWLKNNGHKEYPD